MEPIQRDPVADMTERLGRVNPTLDELTRQRVLNRIHLQLAYDDAKAPRRWRRLAWCVAAAAIVMLGLALRLMPTPAATPLAKSPTPARPRAAAQSPAMLALQPYLVAGTDAERATDWLEHTLTQLELGAGERVHALLGPARIDIIGPAQLTLRNATPQAIELELAQGTLIGDYDHAQSGRLTIRSPGTITEIVGTLFLVQTEGQSSRVAVAHGAVRVRRGAKEFAVGGGQALQAAADAPTLLSASEASALAEHERSFVPGPGSLGILGITGPRLRADVAGKLLADTPLWVKMPTGAHTITLHGAGAGPQQLRVNVRADQRVEGLIAESIERTPPADSPASPRPRAAAASRKGVPAAQPSAAELYRDAEAAMRSSGFERASALLAQLVHQDPNAGVVDLALYELAELASRRADHGAAHVWLTQLEQHGLRPALQEPAAYLRCRNVQARKGAAAYTGCLESFLSRFPDSARASRLRATLSGHDDSGAGDSAAH